jgi:pyrroloquinoline quinone (PQQ) biosynthesis protein C
MLRSELDLVIERAVGDHRLLDHPYYRRWQDGALATKDLREYADQYRHFERVLPEVLQSTARALDPGLSREFVERNLRDELSEPEPHLALFEHFARAVGCSGQTDATRATAELVDVYRVGAKSGPAAALAVIAAYETQAASVAAAKSLALRNHHGLDARHTEFWDVHASMEQSHASWTSEALAHLGAQEETVKEWATRSATAWWSFLDERDQACCN